MPWYKGPTLVECIDKLTEPKRLNDKALRLVVQDAYSINKKRILIVGRVMTGVIEKD